jgi:hypothetical protein
MASIVQIVDEASPDSFAESLALLDSGEARVR